MDKIVRDVIKGEKGAATRFYKIYAPIVRRYLLGKVQSETCVEELLQDTFLSAFDSLPIFRGDASVKTFLISIARHEVLDFYRKRYVRKVVEQTGILWDGVGESLTTPELEWKKKEMSTRFDRTLSRLSKKYQDVLEMRYFKNMSVKEMSLSLELPFKATESLLYRARSAFAEAYNEE